jgi:hypothetical protein
MDLNASEKDGNKRDVDALRSEVRVLWLVLLAGLSGIMGVLVTRNTGAGVSGQGSSAGVGASAVDVYPIVQTKVLDIISDDGKVCAAISAQPDGGAEMTVFGRSGKSRIVIGAFPATTGPAKSKADEKLSYIQVWDENGKLVHQSP